MSFRKLLSRLTRSDTKLVRRLPANDESSPEIHRHEEIHRSSKNPRPSQVPSDPLNAAQFYAAKALHAADRTEPGVDITEARRMLRKCMESYGEHRQRAKRPQQHPNSFAKRRSTFNR